MEGKSVMFTIFFCGFIILLFISGCYKFTCFTHVNVSATVKLHRIPMLINLQFFSSKENDKYTNCFTMKNFVYSSCFTFRQQIILTSGISYCHVRK